MTSCDPYGPGNITFLPNLTKSHLGYITYLIIGFFGRRADCEHQIWISSHQIISKLPLNDLKSHQMTSKWLLNDLKWPIWTWNITFLPNLTLVTRNSNLISAIDFAPKKKRHVTCSKVRFGKKVMFWGPWFTWGHLVVIWRSCWFETQIWWSQFTQRPKKPMKRHITCFKVRFGWKLCFQVLMGHLKSFRGHVGHCWFETQIWWAQLIQRPKKPMKRHIACPKVRFGKKVMFSGHYGSLEVI